VICLIHKRISQNGRLLLSLIIIIAFFLLFNNKHIFVKIKNDYGKTGIGICIFILWLVLFITINLITDKLSDCRKLRQQRKAELKQEEQSIIESYDKLNSLSEQQKMLLERFVRENKRQFQN
jgi:amino acid permease